MVFNAGLNRKINRVQLALGIVAVVSANISMASDGFRLRYNMAGSLGGEIFATFKQPGFIVTLATSHANIDKITNDSGQPRTLNVPAGIVALPPPAPSAIYPSYAATNPALNFERTQVQGNLLINYLSEHVIGNGRLSFGLNLPYARLNQRVGIQGATPALVYPNPLAPGAIARAAVGATFDTTYQAGLAAQASAATGEVAGMGDVEVGTALVFSSDQMRVISGASLVMPTGKYDSARTTNISAGNFYTLRPSIQVSYLPTPDWAVAGRVTLGLNTRNRDNQIRSGNWLGLESAVGYRTPIGALGLHMIYARQFQDDSGGTLGENRFRSTGAGVFFTGLIPAINTSITVQYMSTISSRNSLSGKFVMVRMVKPF